MMDDDSLPCWGTSQCAGKLAGHRLLDWSFYALILVFPVIWCFLFGSWFKSQLEVPCLLQKDYYVDWLSSAARKRDVHIVNVIPGPRPRTGFGGGDVKHCPLFWWYAVGADQATKLYIWHLILHSQCVENGKRRSLVCPPSCRN